MIATTINGCKDTTNYIDTVRVFSLPKAAINGDSIHCKPGVYQYLSSINSVDNIVLYQWYVDNVLKSNAVNLNYNFIAGNHTIGLKVRTSNGCTDSFLRNIIIDSVKSNFNISQQKFCADTGRVQFTDISNHLFTINKYEWFFGDNTNSLLQHPVHTYQQPGLYDVKFVVTTQHGCTDTLLNPSAIKIYRNPVTSFSGSNLHCSPGTYKYFSTSTSDDPIASYQWKINGNIVAVADTLNYNFSPAGLYTIALSVTSNKGCTIDSIRQIIIDSVKAAFSILNPRICGDTGTVRFNNLSGSRFNDLTYQWDFADGQSATTTSPAHFYTAAGNYFVSLKATTANGCSSTLVATDTVKILQTPVVNILGLDEKCMQNKLVYKAAITTQDRVTNYSWKVNNNLIGTADTMLFNFLTAGNYLVQLNVQTQYGCNITKDKPVSIHPLPVPAAVPDTTICLGGIVQIRSFDGSIYQWKANTSLQNINVSNPVANPVVTTNYFVKVTNQFGCEQKDTVTVKVDQPVNLSVSKNDSLCIGERRQLLASSTTSTYLWSPPVSLSNATIANPFAAPLVNTNYQVIAFSNNVCKNDTGFVSIYVGYKPTVNAGADINVAAGTPLQLNTQVTGNDIFKYQWIPATGLDCSNCPNPKLIADNDISYRVTVQTIYGCRATDEIRIVVFCGKGQLYIPSAFSPNNDGLNDRFYIKGYGIAQIKRMLIFNRYGQKVFEKQNVPINDPSQGWDGTNKGEPAGSTAAYVYVLDVICKDGQEFNYKGTIMVVK